MHRVTSGSTARCWPPLLTLGAPSPNDAFCDDGSVFSVITSLSSVLSLPYLPHPPMLQRDLLKDQIEQLGRVLGKIVARLLTLQRTGDLHPGLDEAKQEAEELTGLDIDALLGKDITALEAYAAAHNLTAAHLEKLAEFLAGLAQHAPAAEQSAYLSTALKLLEVADSRSGDYSLTREEAKRSYAARLSAR